MRELLSRLRRVAVSVPAGVRSVVRAVSRGCRVAWTVVAQEGEAVPARYCETPCPRRPIRGLPRSEPPVCAVPCGHGGSLQVR